VIKLQFFYQDYAGRMLLTTFIIEPAFWASLLMLLQWLR
jgi:hypothetical protein